MPASKKSPYLRGTTNQGAFILLGDVLRIASVLRCVVPAVCALSAALAISQVPSGSLNGRVTDAKDAVIVGAQVMAVSRALGAQHITTTNASGLYDLLNLPVGAYDLTIQARGFAQRKVEDVRIEAGNASTVDSRLSVAAAGTYRSGQCLDRDRRPDPVHDPGRNHLQDHRDHAP